MTPIIPRPRRMRATNAIRSLVNEVTLTSNQLIQPYFVSERDSGTEPIKGFEGVHRWSLEALSTQIELDRNRGLKSFLLFGQVPDAKKDADGQVLYADDALICNTVRTLRKRFGDSIVLFTDVCLCPGTLDGHCGIVKNGKVLNDVSVDILARIAASHAEAGVDFVAPSDMMDGRVGAIRRALDQRGFTETGILAYTAKYHSNYYGPFREALASSPKHGDRASYQMDFRNRSEALQELALDVQEGADLVMVKPALAYLDIIRDLSQASPVPVTAYSVSGEYQMAKLLAKAGLVEERKLVLENLTAIIRAGARAVITYSASEALEKGWIPKG